MTTAETLTAAADRLASPPRAIVMGAGLISIDITKSLAALLRAEAEIAAEDARLFGADAGPASDAGDAALTVARAILGEADRA